MMKSVALLERLQRLPMSDGGSLRDQLLALEGKSIDVEVAVSVGAAIDALLLHHHIDDDLRDAFELAYPVLAGVETLQEASGRLAALGPGHLEGLLNGVKGKLAELEAVSVLEERFGGTFELAEQSTQPVWDLIGTDVDGGEILVQVKLHAASASSAIAATMTQQPDVTFALGSELYAAVVAGHPELAARAVDIGVESLTISENAAEALELLAVIEGLEVPDGITDALPYAGEILAGIKLIKTIVDTEREFSFLGVDERRRLHGVRALLLFSRFGVSTVMTTIGGAAGTAVAPGIGTIIGLIAGVGGAIALNDALKPRMVEVALSLTGLEREDLFYYEHAVRIEALARRIRYCRDDVEFPLARALPAH